MNISRIYAILLQEFYITKHSLEVIIDLFYFAIMTIIVFGFFTLFLKQNLNSQTASYLLVGTLLWEIVRISQYSMSLSILWNVWSRNLSNMFITPLNVSEYIFAQMISSIIKSLLIFSIISALSYFFFQFNILSLGIVNLLLFYVSLVIFAWSIGIIILGIIFRYGTRIQALAWGIIFLFQPLTANLYPVKILPDSLQAVAYMLPPTYIFEAARESLTAPAVNWQMITTSYAINFIYFFISLGIFAYFFKKSRKTGQFARNEG